MINADKNHKHTYDAQGKQLCCTQEEKIYSNAGAKALLKEKHHHHHHGHDHDHEHSDSSTIKMFLPSIISLTLLLAAICFDHILKSGWFAGWLKIVWYVLAYIPVGFPVIKEAFKSIIKGEVFSEFFLMGIATIGAFAIGE